MQKTVFAWGSGTVPQWSGVRRPFGSVRAGALFTRCCLEQVNYTQSYFPHFFQFIDGNSASLIYVPLESVTASLLPNRESLPEIVSPFGLAVRR